MRTTAGRWNSTDCVVCEEGGTRLAFVPSRGAKIVSLVGSSREEWLLQPEPSRRKPYPLGAAFTDAEMCGWDECAPTIEAAPTGTGTTAPDHGELWDARWAPTGDGGYRASLPSIGAELTRWIDIALDGSVTLRYRATRLGHEDGLVPLLWAAHPMFVLNAGDRISTDDVGRLWDVSTDPPTPLSDDGSAPGSIAEHELNASRPPGTSSKFYADPHARPSWVRLRRKKGDSLTLSWNSLPIPYLGIWIDRSRFAHADVVAFEPSTGWFDSVHRAQSSGRVLQLAPAESVEWSLTIHFDR